MSEALTDLLNWIQNYKDALPIVGGLPAALMAAVWALYKFRYQMRRDRLGAIKTAAASSPTSEHAPQSMSRAEVEALLKRREAELRAEIRGDLLRELPPRRAEADSLHQASGVRAALRGVFGLLLGVVLAPFLLFRGGFVVPLIAALSLGILGLFFVDSFFRGAALGVWIGLICWVCGVAAAGAVDFVREEVGKDSVRDALVCVVSGAMVGSAIMATVVLTKGGPDSSVLASMSMGAGLGGLAGLMAWEIAPWFEDKKPGSSHTDA